MDITPPHLRCGMGSCPSVHVLEDGRLEVRGELVVIHETLAKAAGHEVKTAEATVAIPAEYFSALPELVHLRSQVASLREALGNLLGHFGARLDQEEFTAVVRRGDLRIARDALGCQAGVTEKGPVSSPSALQKSAGEDAFNPDPSECGVLREEIAAILEVVARDGLPGPRDLDVALDAIMCSINQWLEDAAAASEHFGKARPMVGLLSQLTEEQRAALFAYDGPEYLGGDDKRPDEERASAMSAHSGEAAGLTPQETSDV